MDTSNTLHRHACKFRGAVQYCGHFYALYFEKDQTTHLGGGHRHDWEYVAIWTINGTITEASYSAHGDLHTTSFPPMSSDGRVKFVYHKEGGLTHSMRFAGDNEMTAENVYGRWVLPAIVSWYEVAGEGLANDNSGMRGKFNTFDYGSGTIPLKDSNFLQNLNDYGPANYPYFNDDDIKSPSFNFIRNRHTNGGIHIEHGHIESGPIGVGAYSSNWTFEPVAGTNYFKIRNRWKSNPNQYIHIENGSITSGPIHSSAHSAQWLLEPVTGTNYIKIRNRWVTNQYIHVENGSITSSPIHAGAHSSHWLLEPGASMQ